MILDLLGWLAIADAVAATFLAGVIYAIGRRLPGRVTIGRAVGVAALLSSPAAALYAAVWLMAKLN